MRTLLSLPPNLVESFHKVTGLSEEQFFCTSDPIGAKLGSGGGTTWLLEACCEADQSAEFDQWLGRERRILLHAGGQSRRLPCYAPSGKILTPVPIFRWERGQSIDQTLLDLQLPLYEEILEKAPQSLHTLIASGDVLLRATAPLQAIPEADVVCYGLWADPTLCSHHGVFFMDRKHPEQLDFMLQKPTIEAQSQLMQTHYSLMDIGVWLLSDKAVRLLRERSKQADGTMANYDLYSEFGCALGEHPSADDSALKELSVAILPLPGGEFYHFGTAPELLTSSMAIQNLVLDQRFIIHKEVKRQPSVFTQNANVVPRPTKSNQYVWIENSDVSEKWVYTSHNIITGVPRNNWELTLPEGVCLDVVPVGTDSFVLRPYGYEDAFRGALDCEATHFIGQPVATWASKHGVSLAALGDGKDIQSAKLFPLIDNLDALGRWAAWMISDAPDKELGLLFEALPRLSADEISNQANLVRLFEQRQSFLQENLPALANNWEKSVFYQTNLKHLAKQYTKFALELPEPIAEDAPIMTRIHDAMFRSEILRESDPEAAAKAEAEAFSLQREALTEQAERHKSLPRSTTYSDQIVWGRSPVRIDLAGGWTDTPPHTLLAGGSVINLAIELNGQPPLQVYVKPCKEPVFICRSIDLGVSERIETFEELAMYNKVGSPFSIPKAALSLAGFLPRFSAEPQTTLRQQFEAFGSGIEITLLSAIPAGSGLGTSSILAATVLGALSDFCGLGWDKNEVCNRVLILEQLLTTGGGWQDQYGGVLPGVKLLETQPGFDLTPTPRWLPNTLFKSPDYRDCHLLYYTGVTRTAKNILSEIVRGMFLNSSEHLRILRQMRQHTAAMFDTLQRNDFEGYGRLLRHTWQQNQALDAGTNPPVIQNLCSRIDDLCLGYKLPGAGGGGYLYMVAKSPEAALRIREMLREHPLTSTSRFVDMHISQQGLQVSRS